MYWLPQKICYNNVMLSNTLEIGKQDKERDNNEGYGNSLVMILTIKVQYLRHV